jgi:hypothetical protein
MGKRDYAEGRGVCYFGFGVSDTLFNPTSPVRAASLMQIAECAPSPPSRSISSIQDTSSRIIRSGRTSKARDCRRICMRSRRSTVLSPRVPWHTRRRLGSLDLALPFVQGVLVGRIGGSGFEDLISTGSIPTYQPDEVNTPNSPGVINLCSFRVILLSDRIYIDSRNLNQIEACEARV